MRKVFIGMLSLWVMSTGAWADESRYDTQESSEDSSGQAPGQAEESGMRTRAEAEKVTKGYLKDEAVGIRPQVGIMSYNDQTGTPTTRGALGFTADMNLASTINKDWSSIYIGPSTGIIYSHLGDPGSNFVGTNSTTPTGTGGANMLLIPLNAKAGFNFTDSFRLAAHGGGNLLYRSVANSMNLGDSTFGTSPVWSIFPNVGADAELALGKNVALLARPDWTFTPVSNVFTGTVALSFPMS